MDNNLENQIEPIEQEQAEQVVEQQESQDRNFRKLREEREAAEREATEYRRRALEAERRLAESQKSVEPQEDEYPLADDDFVNHKQVKSYYVKQQEEIASLRNQLDQVSIKAEYPDFDKVVTNDNVEKLVKEYPDLAKTIYESKAGSKAQSKSTYIMIKKLGISDSQVESDNFDKIQKNLSKPKPKAGLASTESELSTAHIYEKGLSKEEKSARWKLMNERARSL